jgi:hypothetical protein
MFRTVYFFAVLALASASGATAQAQPAELVERTLAIVGGQAITLSDVQTSIALGLVDARELDAATEKLVERALVLREVERYSPPEPAEAEVTGRLTAIRGRFDAAGFAGILDAGGFTEARLRDWIVDDLRIAAYLTQRFAADSPERRASLIADWIADVRRRTPVIELWKR